MEQWIIIPNFPNYEVSNMGNVRNIRGNILKPFDRLKNGKSNQQGYMSVHLCRQGLKGYKNETVHSLVMLCFVGPRPKDNVINHKNGIRWDNRLDNLEYCTQSYNRKQDFIHGRQSLRGSKNTQVKLTEKEVMDIVVMYRGGGYTYAKLASIYSVSVSAIANIFSGHTWSYITNIRNKYEKS